MKKNARQHVNDVYSQLQSAENCLNEALNTVEKPENKERIEKTLCSVQDALHCASSTLSNYVESEK